MSDVNTASNVPASDPLQSAAAALQRAPMKLRDAAAEREPLLPAARQLLSRFSYNAGYCISYGVVFPTLFLVNLVPGASTLASGFVEGALAANNYVQSLQTAKMQQPAVTDDRPAFSPAAAPV
jgi:hypothetical protein